MHSDLGAGEIHIVPNYFYASAAARTAATGFNAADRYKFAVQTDDNTVYMLTNHSPVTWLKVGGGPSSGTVTSVGLALPAIFSVSGSPVTTSGTLTGSLANQNANLVFAGPSTGAAAAPTFRSLVAGDIPTLDAAKIGTGTLAIARGGTGSATTAANGVFAGPTSGGAAAPAFRSLVNADLPATTKVGTVALTDAATIAVDASLGNVFTVTLGGNRTLGNPTNAVDGQKMLFRIRQDGTGSRTLAFDTKFRFGTDFTSITLTTAAGKTDYIGVVYHAADDTFDILAFNKGF